MNKNHLFIWHISVEFLPGSHSRGRLLLLYHPRGLDGHLDVLERGRHRIVGRGVEFQRRLRILGRRSHWKYKIRPLIRIRLLSRNRAEGTDNCVSTFNNKIVKLPIDELL